MKRILPLLLTVLMLVTLCACNKNIDGKYTLYAVAVGKYTLKTDEMGMEGSLELKDGKITLLMSAEGEEPEAVEGEYTVSGGAITLSVNGEQDVVGAIRDGVITFMEDGMTLYFVSSGADTSGIDKFVTPFEDYLDGLGS